MKKVKAVFVCQSCGSQSPKWQGKCFECGEFGSLVETVVTKKRVTAPLVGASQKGREQAPRPLSQIEISKTSRLPTEISEFNRVVGGGMVPGSVILLGGEPGIGKSTLLLQVASGLAAGSSASSIQPQASVLYISAEESREQIKLRADRLGITSSNLMVLAENDVDKIIEVSNPQLLIVDSIQTISTADLSSPAGSISQVQECARRLINFVKQTGMVLILVGHVTKQGNLAGPKTLEHLVDTVLYLEGERFSDFRLLRSVKNRFGAVSEIGIFRMGDQGLQEVKNPSAELISNRHAGVPGSVITVTIEGLRPMLLEIQALVTRGTSGFPRRVVTGISLNRLLMLLAVLTKRTGLDFSSQDVYLNVSGGIKILEPAVDLAVCLALASSLKNKAIESEVAAFGEVGLLGEVKKVSREDLRKQQAKKMGFKKILSGGKIRSVKEAVMEVLS